MIWDAIAPIMTSLQRDPVSLVDDDNLAPQ